MKTKMSVFAATLLTAVSATAAQPLVVVTRTAEPNGLADASSLNGDPADYPTPNVAVGLSGCNLINDIGTALRFQFRDPGNPTMPVNVTNFMMTVARYSLYHSGVAVGTWTYQPHGAYNPVGDSSRPDLIARDSTGTQVSVNGTQVVGTNIPTMSSFEILNQNIPLGTASRPLMTTAGESYGLERYLSFTFTYQGDPYSYTIPLPETYVEVRVQPDLLTLQPSEGAGPFEIYLEVSANLTNWFKVPNVIVPFPRPTNPADVIALFPASQTLDGGLLSTNLRRFYRYNQVAISP